jgi:hypothetical protein
MTNYYINQISSINPVFSFQTGEWVPVAAQSDDCPTMITPDYRHRIPDAALRRRMGRLVKAGVAAGLDCVEKSGIGQPDAIITATGLGCLADTEQFLDALLNNREQLLNPTPFIRSTFNTVGAQIAVLLRNHGYNQTYVHRAFSFESALLDAMMLLNEGEARHVLLGAVDEITESARKIMERLWRQKAYKMGESANFFLLSSEKQRHTCARLIDIRTRLSSDRPFDERGFIDRFLRTNNLQPEDIDIVLTGKHDGETLFDNRPTIHFKRYCGEHQTAGSFALWIAVRILQAQSIPSLFGRSAPNRTYRKILIHNAYRHVNHSLILVSSGD